MVAACLPDPALLGDAMHGKTCAGLWVTGNGKDGKPREVYLYHVVDNADTMRDFGTQCVVWQTAINPVVALELLAAGTWSGAGVLGPEAFDAVPFLDLLAGDYGSPWGLMELSESSSESELVNSLAECPQILRELAHAHGHSFSPESTSF